VNQGFLTANVGRAGNLNPRWDTTQQLRDHGIVGDIRHHRISWCDFDWLFEDTPQNRQVLTANGIYFNAQENN
jgi:hypothetical protein|tara:strand:- start:186 stop:404 length:219 start_codon:yes stop_codon:yes gene_type:complete